VRLLGREDDPGKQRDRANQLEGGANVMVFAADYPFLEVMWSMFVFFAFIIWLWMLFSIIGDVFRRRDIGGWSKAAWCVFLIVLPFLGTFVYLIANHDGMAERSLKQVQTAQAQVDEHIRSVAGGPAAEIDKAKQLLDRGAITQAEFEAIKAKALS
jgi:Short C-terminal domain/Phospholipase_D-nuclease N-terminal